MKYKAVPLLGPVINERRAKMDEFGDGWVDRPVRFQRDEYDNTQ